ncbi:MAG: DUF4230 domain-containing protein, partial [Flavobacteriaceae bacterium]|nr:DUF4230 domain-containing protein [Flavobacteriaceae bacterium]
LNEEAKQHILEKVPESGLFNVAKQEALESLQLVENIVQTIGWKLDYQNLVLDTDHVKKIRE